MDAERAPKGLEAFQIKAGGLRADGSLDLEKIQKGLGPDRKPILLVQTLPLDSEPIIITLKKS